MSIYILNMTQKNQNGAPTSNGEAGAVSLLRQDDRPEDSVHSLDACVPEAATMKEETMGGVEDEWRKLLIERIDGTNERLDRTIDSIEKHLEKDEGFYLKVAELEFGATMAGRMVKFGAAIVGALGIERLYNLFKH